MEKYTYKDITESTLIKSTYGELGKIVINSHSSGTIKIIDGLYNGAQATGTLTSSGALVAADYAVGTLTSDATAVVDGATVVVGATGGTPVTYTARTAFSSPSVPNEVLIGSTADGSAFLANLKKAINLTGTFGIEYSLGTAVNPDIIAYTLTSTTLKVGFRIIGAGGNAYTTTETSSHLSWGGGTLAGGVATTNSTITIDAITYVVTLTLGDTLGLTTPYQVLWVTSEAVFLDNFKSAINCSGLPGTDYSASTSPHPSVYATTNTNTTQVVVTKNIGSAGNSIATTETLANYAWGATTLASGTGPTGRIMHNTITLSAVATTGERYIDLTGETFDTACLIAITGGTADLTVQYR